MQDHMCLHPLAGLKWDHLPHTLHSPNIAPSDFYLFLHLQLHLAGAIFHSAQAIQNEADKFLDSWPSSFWALKIYQNVGRKSHVWVMVTILRTKGTAFTLLLTLLRPFLAQKKKLLLQPHI
ncbi:Histone-lysine N-methyltransferase SETMAR, partial [Stegodyphus mimosarum]